MSTTAAIVTTLKRPGPSLVSFLKYHVAIGFSRFFLFFDDPSDPYINVARRFKQTRIIKTNARLRRAWQQTKTAQTNPWFFQYVEKELKVRQTLNVELAIDLARGENIDWLIHIDCDELFYPFNGDALSHFTSAAKRRRNNLVYANYEGIPESSDIVDYFKKVTLFKKNFALFHHRLTASQQQLIKRVPQLPPHLFLFYANGKSAARISPGLEPDGGHRFKYRNDDRNGSENRRQDMPVLCQDAIVLHYPCCGFTNFWRKYKMLGAFANLWFDTVDIVDAIGTFHLKSRDIVASGSKNDARKFYEANAVIGEGAVIQLLIDKEICCRIQPPSMFLKRKISEPLEGMIVSAA